MFYFDAHCDTLSKALDEGKSLYDNNLQFSISRAEQLGGGIQVLACFVDTEFLNSKNAGFIRCNNILKKLREYEKQSGCNILITDRDDLLKAVDGDGVKVMLSIENGAAISGNLENVDYFYNQGVRIMSVTWNDDNELGCGAKTLFDTGLTELGFDYIKRLNKLGIVVDVSQCSEKSFWDVVSISSKPVVATHSNVYEICKNPRNLKDDQIRAIARSGGIIGICYYTDFLNSNKRADVKDIVRHIKYIKELIGIDYVGLGSDFDGMPVDKTALGIENVSMVDNITKELKMQGFSDEDIVKIMWKNWVNVLKKYM